MNIGGDDTAAWGAHVSPQRQQLYSELGWMIEFVDARGEHLIDRDSNRYLDLVGGYGTAVVGHRHPEVMAALQGLLNGGPPFTTPIGVPFGAGTLAGRLLGLAGDWLHRVVFCSAGSEAMGVAMKFASAATRRDEFIAAADGFHGLTPGPLSLTGNQLWRSPFHSLPGPVVHHLPFGEVSAIEHVVRSERIAAVVLEPVQGIGGARPWPVAAFSEIGRLCQASGTLLVMDEVLTGLGRTGGWFAFQRAGDVRPDIVVVSKALTGGAVPVAAVLMTKEVQEAVIPDAEYANIHHSTFESHLLGMASGLAVLDLLERQQLPSRALTLGERLRTGIGEMTSLGVREVRGAGLLLAFQVRGIADPDDSDGAEYCQQLLLDNGILVYRAAHRPDWVKLTPPLTLSDDAVDEFLSTLEGCLVAVAAERRCPA